MKRERGGERKGREERGGKKGREEEGEREGGRGLLRLLLLREVEGRRGC